jgi:hypothetical protein
VVRATRAASVVVTMLTTLVLPRIAVGVEQLVATSGSTSTSTVPEPKDFVCAATFRLYDPEEIVSLDVTLPYSNCTMLVPGTSISMNEFGMDITGFPNEFRGPAALVRCTALFHHDSCPHQLDDLEVIVREARGPNGILATAPNICAELLDCSDWPCGDVGPFRQVRCGDVDSNGAIRTNDALSALRSAVGLSTCSPQQCDTDRDGTVETSDARAILAASVGATASLICPAPCTSATGNAAP